MDKRYVIGFEQLGMGDVDKVGGKNASLGEMLSHLTQLGVLVPGGFATTSDAYREFLAHDGLAARISKELASLNVDDVVKLAATGARIRHWITALPYPSGLEQAIRTSYSGLIQQAGKEFSVAVRSSATAEDLPDASFAGQQETILNVRGIDQVLQAVKEVFASLYNDRAIAYRVHHGFEHAEVALSAGIQRMVRSDLGASGVLFTLDTESGFDKVVFITAAYGLGETVVQGLVNPDEFYVYKPALASGKYPIIRRSLGSKLSMMIYGDGKSNSHTVKTIEVHREARMRFSITDTEVITLAKQAVIIEKHYARPMDIEWAKDGTDGKLYILQARPETVKSRKVQSIERYTLKSRGSVLAEGRSIGQKIGTGTAKIVQNINEMTHIKEGDVLITDMTDPDWEPIMKRAAAIVTNRGGRTCHAAIIARELGIPAVVGCGDATHKVKDGQTVTVSCAEGDTGHVYAGKLEIEYREINLGSMPKAPLKIMMNVGNPERAFSFAMLPNNGVGLARLEFIINRMIGVHPKALINFETQTAEIKHQIQERIAGYRDPVSFYVERLVEGIATIAASFAPEPVIVRTSDFKSNEYGNLIGGRQYEPHEENPMLGFRGASRYIAKDFRDCFELECRALRKVREEMGFDNVQVMIPFVRTVEEAQQVTELLSAKGLKRGENGLKIIMMCELPSNAVLAEQFLQYFDGFSIGSNDMTQLTLGLDRDSGVIAHLFDERNDAVKSMLSMAIQACRKHKKYIGICGQGPSDHPDLARWLLNQGIESISLNPDTVLETWLYLAGASN